MDDKGTVCLLTSLVLLFHRLPERYGGISRRTYWSYAFVDLYIVCVCVWLSGSTDNWQDNIDVCLFHRASITNNSDMGGVLAIDTTAAVPAKINNPIIAARSSGYVICYQRQLQPTALFGRWKVNHKSVICNILYYSPVNWKPVKP